MNQPIKSINTKKGIYTHISKHQDITDIKFIGEKQ
jgi:hypothetical protein